MAGASGGAALGGPQPNPKGDGPRLQSLEGKGKPVPLADITNTGRPNPTRSISVADVVKENAKLHHLLSERTKIIEVSRVEMQKLRLALQASRQQNLQLAQTNSQMLVELNLGKDRVQLKLLQHELSCTSAVLKAKDSELECKHKTANQRRKKVNSQEVMKAIPSKVAAVEAHQIDGSVTSAVEHHLVESQSAVPSNTDCQVAPQDTTKKRGTNKRKSESSECVKDTNKTRDHYKPHLQPIMSLDHEDTRKPLRRRSSRLNSGSCEVTEVSHKTSHEDAVAFETELRIFQKQHGPTTEKDTESLQNECSAIVHEVVVASEFKKIEINEQPRKEASLKEIQEACSRIPGVEAHQFGDKANNTKQSHLAETQSYLPFNIVEPPKPPEDTVSKRAANKQKLELCESGKDPTIEDINATCNSSTSDPLLHEEKRKSQRRKSSRLNSVSSEDTKSTFETLHEDVIAPLPSSSSNASMEQRTNQQSDSCSSMKSTEGQVAGRRSLRRAAEKVVSYKEIPLNVKMRRP